MAMFRPSQSHSGGVTVKPYTGNITQEFQFLMEKTGKITNPIFRPSNYSMDVLRQNLDDFFTLGPPSSLSLVNGSPPSCLQDRPTGKAVAYSDD